MNIKKLMHPGTDENGNDTMIPEFSIKTRGYFINTTNVNDISDKISNIYKN